LDTTFEIFAPDGLRKMLQLFSFRAAKKGDSYFQQGRVEDVGMIEPGREFDISVRGQELYTVTLWHDAAEKEWANECDCPLGSFCKHAYAATKALLAEASAASVNKLSAGKKAAAPENVLPLAGLLSEKIGRPLNSQELKFFHTLHRVYLRAHKRDYVTVPDIEEIGLHLNFSYWETPSLWPRFPDDEHLFWLFLARAARDKKRPIPEFLEPITDLSQVDEVVRLWRREEEIKQWRHRLGSLHIARPIPPGSAEEGYDVRLMFLLKHAELQWKRPGKDGFETPKVAALRDIVRQGGTAFANLPLEAQVIWQIFAGRLNSIYDVRLAYYNDDTIVTLVNLLALPALASRTVNSEGEPLRRVAEPLRWQLTRDAEDYVLQVVQFSGAHLPPVLFIAKARTNIYVTSEAVFTGPVPAEPLLKTSEENRIPAVALETEEGVNLLSQLDIPLPSPLRERIENIPLQVVVRCALDSSSGKEMCDYRARRTIVAASRRCHQVLRSIRHGPSGRTSEQAANSLAPRPHAGSGDARNEAVCRDLFGLAAIRPGRDHCRIGSGTGFACAGCRFGQGQP
jgi:hypothetical protein